MKRYSILGVSLEDFSAREGLRKADRFLRSGALNTAAYITAQTVAMASKDEEIKQLLEKTDLVFCMEPDILEAAGIAGAGRVREIEERVFLREFLRRMGRLSEEIFILGDTKEEAEQLRDMLLEQQDNLHIVDCRGYDEFDNQQDRLMNAINVAAPKVIFSRMTWPEDLRLMHIGRKFLSAELWIAIAEKKMPGKRKATFLDSIRKRIFQKKVNEYNQEKAVH